MSSRGALLVRLVILVETALQGTQGRAVEKPGNGVGKEGTSGLILYPHPETILCNIHVHVHAVQHHGNKVAVLCSYPGVEVSLVLVAPDHTMPAVTHTRLGLLVEVVARVTGSQQQLLGGLSLKGLPRVTRHEKRANGVGLRSRMLYFWNGVYSRYLALQERERDIDLSGVGKKVLFGWHCVTEDSSITGQGAQTLETDST